MARRCGCDFVLEMMNFVLEMMNFVFKMMNFVFKMMEFVLKSRQVASTRHPRTKELPKWPRLGAEVSLKSAHENIRKIGLARDIALL